MLLPRAAFRQPSKAPSMAASDSLLPRTGCSLRSGCAMDERHSVGTQSSTLRGRGRAGKLTQVSFAVAQHGAAAPAFVRARSSPPSACSATLLQPRRRTTPLLRERLGRSTSGLKPYIERNAVDVWFHAASRDTERRRSERGRTTDLTRSCEIVRSDPPTFGPYRDGDGRGGGAVVTWAIRAISHAHWPVVTQHTHDLLGLKGRQYLTNQDFPINPHTHTRLRTQPS